MPAVTARTLSAVAMHLTRACTVAHHVAAHRAGRVSARGCAERAPAHRSRRHAFDRPADDAALALHGARHVALGDRPVLDVANRLRLRRLDRLHRRGVRRLRFGDVHRTARKKRGACGGCRQFRQGHLDRHGLLSRFLSGIPARRVRSEVAPVVSGNGSHPLPTIELTMICRSRWRFSRVGRVRTADLSHSGTGWLTALNRFALSAEETGSIWR